MLEVSGFKFFGLLHIVLELSVARIKPGGNLRQQQSNPRCTGNSETNIVTLKPTHAKPKATLKQ